MSQTYLEATLLPHENLRHRATLSLWAHFGWLLLGILLTPFVVGLFLLIALWIRMRSTELAVTDKRVLVKTGFIERQTVEMNLDCIEAIQVHQTFGGRLFNYGTLIITGAGTPQAPISNIKDPLTFRREALLAQDALKAQERGRPGSALPPGPG